MQNLSTTDSVLGKEVVQNFGIVTSEVIFGANVVRDIFASFRDFFGGRSRSYEKVLTDAKNSALEEILQRAQSLGADSVIGVRMDTHSIAGSIVVSAIGTAVKTK